MMEPEACSALASGFNNETSSSLLLESRYLMRMNLLLDMSVVMPAEASSPLRNAFLAMRLEVLEASATPSPGACRRGPESGSVTNESSGATPQMS